jgi:hypothetical protein
VDLDLAVGQAKTNNADVSEVETLEANAESVNEGEGQELT